MKDNEGREDILTELQEEDFYPTNSDLLESLERTKGSILEEDRIKLF